MSIQLEPLSNLTATVSNLAGTTANIMAAQTQSLSNLTATVSNIAVTMSIPKPRDYQLPDWLERMARGAQILSAAAMFFLFYVTLIVSIRQKRADVYTADHEMYDNLLILKAQLIAHDQNSPVTKAKAETYFLRFWYLQFYAYRNWRDGFLDSELYETWLTERRSEFNNTAFKLGDMTHQDGWTKAKKTYPESDFSMFMDQVLQGNEKISKLMKQARGTRLKRFRKLFIP